MKQQKKKKPTMKEMEKVVASLIMENRRNQIEILRTQQALSDYIDFNKNGEQFTKYVEDLNGKSDKKDSK
jgi:hypothetical protein